ncbi:hypothetical protein N9Z08_00205 [Pirellulales bacterium]|nr:hypothetical protein [Pirellulales bacterium]
MSKSIDPKSFIIGVLSSAVVCLAMGANPVQQGWDYEQQWEFYSVPVAFNGVGTFSIEGHHNLIGFEPWKVTRETNKNKWIWRRPKR